MKNNSINTVLAIAIAMVGAILYTVLYYMGTVPGAVPLAQNGVRLALVVFGSMAVLPLTCKCENKCMCNAAKGYLPAAIFAAVGTIATSAFLQLFTPGTRISYILSQFAAVFFEIFLPVIWGMFLYEIIISALCGCNKPKPPKDNCDDDFGYSDNKYKY